MPIVEKGARLVRVKLDKKAWQEMREEFVFSEENITFSELARRYEVTRQAVHHRAKAEGWNRVREEHAQLVRSASNQGIILKHAATRALHFDKLAKLGDAAFKNLVDEAEGKLRRGLKLRPSEFVDIVKAFRELWGDLAPQEVSKLSPSINTYVSLVAQRPYDNAQVINATPLISEDAPQAIEAKGLGEDAALGEAAPGEAAPGALGDASSPRSEVASSDDETTGEAARMREAQTPASPPIAPSEVASPCPGSAPSSPPGAEAQPPGPSGHQGAP